MFLAKSDILIDLNSDTHTFLMVTIIILSQENAKLLDGAIYHYMAVFYTKHKFSWVSGI